ncbi:hypothetical protein PCK1_001977 [Pneumocystis canis]|nr:hypothetical protein PCK1_001977 [Pneumocystis canis]
MIRRACYKCGDLGHFADSCTKTDRLCYNCKQPGHESNACPFPRTTERMQCYYCQSMGHIQADCPSFRINTAGICENGSQTSKSCYRCGNLEHLAKDCTTILPANDHSQELDNNLSSTKNPVSQTTLVS